MTDKSPALMRDYTGILVCALIVFASISLGFVQVAVKVFLGQDVSFDPSWTANLSSMASMALGALIQQKVDQLRTALTIAESIPPALTRSDVAGAIADAVPIAAATAATAATAAAAATVAASPVADSPAPPSAPLPDDPRSG